MNPASQGRQRAPKAARPTRKASTPRTTAADAAPDPKDSDARLRAVFDTAVEGIVTIDDRGRIDSINPAAERMFGWSPGELLGKNINALMPEPYRSGHDGHLARYRKTRQRRIIGIGREVFGRRKDGTVFP
ncbi:MAG: hypothetical protein RL153_1060, partial [Verrucomicrobiota bacterium]